MSKYAGKIVTNQAPAGYSVFFDGTGDWLSIADSAQFNLGTSNYTMEFWVYPTSFSAQVVPFAYQWSSGGGTRLIAFAQNTNGTYLVYYYDASNGFTSTNAVTLNAWNHVALVRNSNTFTLYINGVSGATNTTAITYPDSPYPVYIGASYDGTTGTAPYVGYISNLRVVIGTAVYTSNFTPPTQLFPITNTRLLTCQSPTIVDNSTNNFTITTSGDARVSTFTPFPAYNVYPTTANPLVPAPGVWTLDEAMQLTQQGVWPSYPANAIEDVFSTWLYTGTGSAQTITNGVNLSGQGGMVWLKGRSGATDHALYDTNRGATFDLVSNSTAAQTTQTTGLTAFNSNGFSIGSLAKLNTNAATYASWTFRKQAKFFDVVTYTGNGALSRTISHNLGSAPGFIIIKETSQADDWCCLARDSSGNYQYLFLNNTATTQGSSSVASTATSTTVDLGVIRTSGFALNQINEGGFTYVMYLFAHNAGGFGPAGTDNVISCGSYTGNGAPTQTITLGYEPQWLLVKRTDAAASWWLTDVMRGMPNSGADSLLFPNSSSAENTSSFDFYEINPTGFTAQGSSTANASGAPYIYIAIRRGPMRPPTTGTSVFSPITQTSTGSTYDIIFSNVAYIDAIISYKDRNTGGTYNAPVWNDRLRGFPNDMTGATYANNPGIISSSTQAEVTGATSNYLSGVTMNRAVWGGGWTGYLGVFYGFRRAPGFFDEVCYTGTGSTRTVTHNLTVAPELLIVKPRSSSVYDWNCYHVSLGNTKYIALNTALAASSAVSLWNNTTPTSTVFTVNHPAVNDSGTTYVAYLFATVGGVSKVGSYTGTGTTQQINCGFTNGSRFVLIKRTDSTGDWYVWDSARGIVAGNDPYLLLNSTAAEVTNTDYVDTYSLGFELSSTAPAALNASGGSYIFLAIA